MKFKLTSLEKQWVMYDVGNSAFIMLVTTIIPIYFHHLASSAGINEVDYLAYWAYATTIATIIVAFIAPIVGSISDGQNSRRKIFMTFALIGIIGCTALGFASSWFIFLLIFVIAKVGYSSSLVFYDAMLNDVTTDERIDRVSSHGYAWGYIGSCLPFIISLIFVLKGESFGLAISTSMKIAFLITSIWWLIMTLPIFKNYKQVNYVEVENKNRSIQLAFKRLWETLKTLKDDKPVFFFLLAFFFYIDGVFTIMQMATAYGTSLGLDSTGLVLALLLTQIVAFPSALFLGRISKKFGVTKIIGICILVYLGITLFGLQLDHQWEFWVLAVCVGLVQGGIQALSRSYFAKIIPAEKSGEYFGLFDICGKGASFLGTFLMGYFSKLFNSVTAGIYPLIVMFILGLILFSISLKAEKEQSLQ